MPFQVLIVEDDAMIAAIYKRTVTSIDGLEVAGVVGRGEDALALLARKHCDLLLLDLKLSGMSGLNLVQELRASGSAVEVIAVTACRNSDVVRAMIQRGAIDYLVKPFTVERLRQSLTGFLQRVAALHEDQLDQAAVDQVCAAGRSAKRCLPNGLTQAGISRVREALRASSEAHSSTEVATITGLARVTARRYLEYLVSTEQASVEAPPSGTGRPRKLYRWLPDITVEASEPFSLTVSATSAGAAVARTPARV